MLIVLNRVLDVLVKYYKYFVYYRESSPQSSFLKVVWCLISCKNWKVNNLFMIFVFTSPTIQHEKSAFDFAYQK